MRGVGVVEPRNMCEGVNIIFSLEFFLRIHGKLRKWRELRKGKQQHDIPLLLLDAKHETNATPIVVNISNNHFCTHSLESNASNIQRSLRNECFPVDSNVKIATGPLRHSKKNLECLKGPVFFAILIIIKFRS
jgi:hypothetical protein